MGKCKVNNMPEDVRAFVVARIDEADCSLWYWGSWDDKESAVHTALDIGGMVLPKEDCR